MFNKNLPLRTTLVAAATMGLWLGGCTVGPNFHPPQVAMPKHWSGGNTTGTTTASTHPATVAATQPAAKPQSIITTKRAHLATWWTNFHDPELTALIQQAATRNLTILQAQVAIRQARYARDIAAANLGPFVSANASYQRSGTSNNLTKAGGTRSTGNMFQSGLNGSWELDIFGGVKRSVEAANDNLAAADENSHTVMITLLSEVATDYITLRGVQQQLFVARTNIHLQQQTVTLTRRQFQNGLNTELALADAESQLATTESQIAPLQTQQQQLIYALSVLLGQPPAALQRELSTPRPIPPVPPSVPIGLPAQLLLRRPDVRTAESQLAAATAEIGVATAELYPTFVINGNLGFSSQSAANWFDSNSLNWGIGPSVSWAIFSSGQIESTIHQNEAIRDEYYLAYRQSVLTALQQVDSAIAAYTHEQEHEKALQAAVKASQQATKLSLELYKAGLTDFLNVLQAQQSLYAAQNSLVLSKLALSNDLVSLYQALGGGWHR